MTTSTLTFRRAMVIHLTSRGFGFVVLESPTVLIDWGVKATRTDKARKTLARVSELMEQYSPELLVLEATDKTSSRRCSRIEQLLTSIKRLAAENNVPVRRVSMLLLRKMFQAYGATTKHQIAHIVAKLLPELAPHVPRHRKPWMSEDYRMAIFTAAALGLTYFYTRLARRSNEARHLSD